MAPEATSPYQGEDSYTEFRLKEPSKRTAKKQRKEGEFFKGTTLSEIARYGGYNSYRAPGFTDPWVRKSLKTFDITTYDSMRDGTRRGKGTEGMMESLMKFDGPKVSYDDLNRRQQRHMNRAIAKARRAFTLPTKYQPLDWHEIGQHIRPDTSAGVTFVGKKKGEVMAEIYSASRALAHKVKVSGKNGFNPTRIQIPPCMAGERGAMSTREDPKSRLVWVYPAEMLVLEGQYAPTLYDEYAKLPNSPMLAGKSAQRLYTEWIANHKDGETLIGLDFSKFDSTVPAWLIRAAFDILHDQIEWETWNGERVAPAERTKWNNIWQAVVWYFINTPILLPNGRMFRKYRGVPSGSWFTQLIDSVVNYIVVEYITSLQHVEAKGLRVLGDDSGFRSSTGFSLEQASKDASSTLAMNLKPEKCELTKDPSEFKLLGTTYRMGHQHRATEEWFRLALYPENIPPDIETSMSRLVGLWIGGAMWDKRFSDFFAYYQTCYDCPKMGWFSKNTRRWLEIATGGKGPRGWTTKENLFWRSIFYTM
jgi:hypothetical protein